MKELVITLFKIKEINENESKHLLIKHQGNVRSVIENFLRDFRFTSNDAIC